MSGPAEQPIETRPVRPLIRCTGLLGFPPVLDACCGARQMWFDKQHPLALFMDRRSETVEWDGYETQPDGSKKYRRRTLDISPDVMGDFTRMDFPDNTFSLIAFDPPHFDTLNANARTAKMYGRLFGDWETELAAAFRECFRVLKPLGTLVFKWNSTCIPLERVLALSPEAPLFGHTAGRQAKTHWCVFLKPNYRTEP